MTVEQLETINYLNKAFYLNKRIDALIAEKKENEHIAMKCTANYDNDGSTNPSKGNSQEKILIKIAEQENEIDCFIDKLVDIRKDISNQINSLETMDEQTVLSLRYLSYMTIEEIAETMHYHRNTIQNKHNSAIKNIVLKCALQV